MYSYTFDIKITIIHLMPIKFGHYFENIHECVIKIKKERLKMYVNRYDFNFFINPLLRNLTLKSFRVD